MNYNELYQKHCEESEPSVTVEAAENAIEGFYVKLSEIGGLDLADEFEAVASMIAHIYEFDGFQSACRMMELNEGRKPGCRCHCEN